MKHKRADHADWPRLLKKRFTMQYYATPAFTGYACLLCIDEVTAPLWRTYQGHDVCLADNGYTWLQLFPKDTHYAVTTIFDGQGVLTRFYIDVCLRHSIDAQGMLWYDDLYIDLDISPDGEITLLDVDELDEALHDGGVSALEYELAWREANSLMTVIEEDMFPLLWTNDMYRDDLLKKVPQQHLP
jgi:predicted RNA-binding protein associated with RNAse of E/G family